MQYTRNEMRLYAINSDAGPPIARDRPVETKRPVPMAPPRALDQLISMTIILERNNAWAGGLWYIVSVHHLDMAVFQAALCLRIASVEQVRLDEIPYGAVLLAVANLNILRGFDLFRGRTLILYVRFIGFGGLGHG